MSLRIAVEVRRRSDRARIVEREVMAQRLADAAIKWPDADLIAALHEEIGRLPERYCIPVVLCDLQSLTRDEAASRLGCPPGTVAGRLSRARTLLRDRLGRRGLIAVGAVLEAALLARPATAAIEPRWMETIVHKAVAFGLGWTIALEGGSIAAVSYAEEVCRAMMRANLIKMTTAAVIILMAGLAVGWGATKPAEALHLPKAVAEPQLGATAPGDVLDGVILGPDDKPMGNVGIYYSVRSGNLSWGHVLAEGRSDSSGRYRIEWPAELRGQLVPSFAAIWGYRPGALMAAEVVQDGTRFGGSPARLATGPPARTIFDVRSPDGHPIAGAKIKPRVIDQGYLGLPDGLAEKIEAQTVTGERGRAVMTAFHPEQIGTFFVTAEGFGTQQFAGHSLFGGGPRKPVDPSPLVVTLFPVGRLKGRLVGPIDQVKGRRLVITARNPLRPSLTPGLYYPVADAEGRFEVSAVVAGTVGIEPESDLGTSWTGQSPPDLTVEAGQLTEVEIKLSAGVPVRGIVRERGTERPIAGVSVMAYPGVVGRSVTTDAHGRFAGTLARGRSDLAVASVPEGYARPYFGMPTITIPLDVDSFEIPAIELSRAGSIKGVAVDDHGRFLAGAMITASWTVEEGARGPRETTRTARADRNGTFLVPNVALDSEAELTAARQGLSTPEPAIVPTDGRDRVRLVLNSAQAVSLSGRVVDERGKPVANAKVRVRRQRVDRGFLADLNAAANLVTDAEGRFKTPEHLLQGESYVAYAEATGYDQARTEWTPASDGTFPDLTLLKESPPATVKD